MFKIYFYIFFCVISFSTLHGQGLVFVNSDLEKSIKEEIGISPNTLLTQDIANAIESLDLQGLGLTDIRDLKYFNNLKYLNISNNELVSLCALESLQNLYFINCENNFIKSLDCMVDFNTPKLLMRVAGNNITSFIRPENSLLPVIYLEGKNEQYRKSILPDRYIYNLTIQMVSASEGRVRISYRCYAKDQNNAKLYFGDSKSMDVKTDGVGRSIDYVYTNNKDYLVKLEVGTISKTISIPFTSVPIIEKIPTPSNQSTGLQILTRTTSSVNISWIRGNGSGCIVAICPTTSNANHPVDGFDYNANSDFSVAPVISGDTKVIYKGIDNSLNITGLQPNSGYKIFVYEMNGIAINERKYLRTPLNWDVAFTDVTPFVKSNFEWSGYPLSSGVAYSFFNTSVNSNTYKWSSIPTASFSNALAPNTSITFPNSGTYQVSLESKNNNNGLFEVITKTITILAPAQALPDAVVRNVRVTPLSITAGQQISVKFEAANLSNFASISNAQVQFVISADETIDASPTDWYSGIQTISLQPGEMKDFVQLIQVPATLSGNQRILIKIDNPLVIAELNEANNQSSGGIIIVAAKSDLKLTSLNVGAAAPYTSGQKIGVTIGVNNSGQIYNVRESGVDLYISKDNVLDPLDFQFNQNFFINESAVYPNQTKSFSSANIFQIPEDIQAGSYYLIAAIDHAFIPGYGFDYNSELDENNNTFAIPFNIANSGQPTLPISNLKLKRTGLQSVELSWTNGNGNKRIVIGRQRGIPHYPKDNIAYVTNSSWPQAPFIFDPLMPSSTTEASRVLYFGTGNSVTISGLPLDSTYYFSVLEATDNGGTSINYFQTAENTVVQTHIENVNQPWRILNRWAYSDAFKFINKDTGYMHTNIGFASTKDGGESWLYNCYKGREAGYSNSENFDNVFFANSLIGFIINNKEIYKTTDGGQKWFPIYTHMSNIINIAAPSVNTLFMFSADGDVSSKIYKSTNGGIIWTLMYSIPFRCYGIQFQDINNGVIIARNGSIYKTNNAGISWTSVNTNTGCSLPSFAPIKFTNLKTGFFADYCGNIYRSLDGGINWERRKSVGVGKFFSIDFSDRLNGTFHDGSKYFIRTNDGGEIFLTDSIRHPLLTSGSRPGLLKMPDPNTLILRVGDALFKTITSGRTESLTIPNSIVTGVCPDSDISVPYILSGSFDSLSNEITVELSDSIGLFGSPQIIGKQKSDSSGIINAKMPVNLQNGNAYKIRIRASNPGIISNTTNSISYSRPPLLSMTSISDTLLSTTPQIILSGVPNGGIFYLDSNITNVVSPTLLSTGLHILEYRYPSNGCFSSIKKSFFVKVPRTINISSNVGNSFCSGKVLKAKITFAGTWDSATIINLQLSNSSGSFTLPKLLKSFNAVNVDSIDIDLPVDISTGFGYKIRAITSDGNFLSNSTTAFVVESAKNPIVTINTTDTSLCFGTNAIFSSTIASSGANPKYEWLLNGVNVGSNLSNYSSNVLNNGDAVQLHVKWNTGCTLDSISLSNLIVIKVAKPVQVPIVESFEDFLFSNIAEGNQWLKNGQPITEATNQFFAPSASGIYQVRITNAPCPTLTSPTFQYIFSGIYYFIGSGNWSVATNWQNGLKPPTTLPTGYTIVINPAGSGECVLDVNQTIAVGASFTVATGKKFRIPGNLRLNRQ